ncbi:MAG: zeta toxin family protein [Lentisphaerae bacterium]|nr:zeta toxin family protein [Lentisphaerota bacterium]
MKAEGRKQQRPVVYVIAGPNGAGKTTFANRYLQQIVACRTFVNADMIAQGLSPYDVDAVAMAAGKLFLRRIDELVVKRVDFAFETTLSGRSYLHLFRELKLSGYTVHLIFLWIPMVELSLERIAVRVSKGGHNIPSEVARRRFTRSMHNLLHVYRDLCDDIVIFDNQGDAPHKVAVLKGTEQVIHDETAYAMILEQARGES